MLRDPFELYKQHLARYGVSTDRKYLAAFHVVFVLRLLKAVKQDEGDNFIAHYNKRVFRDDE